MSATFLTTLSIVLIEIIVALLIILTVLFLRFRSLKSILKKINTPKEITAEKPEKIISFLTYIKDEINRTTDRLEEQGKDNKTPNNALANRLDHLSKEKNLIDLISDTKNTTDYWELIENTYVGEINTGVTQATPDNSDREDIYLARINNLERFKEMFFNTQAKLKESFDTIDALKHKISQMPSSEENSQLEEMIDKLSIDNIGLNKQLNSANDELNNILSDSDTGGTTNATDSPADESNDDIENLREENEFLSSQIQYLLQQEIERAGKMQEKISGIEQALQDKEEECETLKLSSQADDSPADGNSDDKIKSLEEENNFLTDQIQHLLQQELQATGKMQEQISAMDTNLKAKESEFESLQNTSTGNDNTTETDLPAKLASIEEENEFLAQQIQHLLTQELEATDKIQEQISSMETDLRFKEAEIDALKNNRKASSPDDHEDLSAKLQSIEEENEFLASQIQFLLQQELEATKKMQDKMAFMSEELSAKQAECEALSSANAPTAGDDDSELSLKLQSTEEENEFLSTQIQHLLQQEIAYSNNMQEQMTALKTSLLEKEAEYTALENENTTGQNDEQIKDLNNKLHSIEEENEFLMSQIQHLLAQEVEHSKKMMTQVESLEDKPAKK